MKSIDSVFNLSEIFGLKECDPGILLVTFIFSVVWQLLDASLDDEGLLERTPEKKSRWPNQPQDMEIDGQDSFGMKEATQQEMLQKANTALAIEMIVEFLQNTVTARILYLARRNMYVFLFLPLSLRRCLDKPDTCSLMEHWHGMGFSCLFVKLVLGLCAM